MPDVSPIILLSSDVGLAWLQGRAQHWSLRLRSQYRVCASSAKQQFLSRPSDPGSTKSWQQPIVGANSHAHACLCFQPGATPISPTTPAKGSKNLQNYAIPEDILQTEYVCKFAVSARLALMPSGSARNADDNTLQESHRHTIWFLR